MYIHIHEYTYMYVYISLTQLCFEESLLLLLLSFMGRVQKVAPPGFLGSLFPWFPHFPWQVPQTPKS